MRKYIDYKNQPIFQMKEDLKLELQSKIYLLVSNNEFEDADIEDLILEIFPTASSMFIYFAKLYANAIQYCIKSERNFDIVLNELKLS